MTGLKLATRNRIGTDSTETSQAELVLGGRIFADTTTRVGCTESLDIFPQYMCTYLSICVTKPILTQ